MRVLFQQIAVLAIIGVVAAGQTPTLKTRTKEDREREFQANHRITLNVQVTDAAGKPVTDLGPKDFTIFDNQQPRKLAAFHAIDGEAMNDATEIIILLDAVNTPTQQLDAEKAGIFKYLAQSHAALPYPTSFVLWSNGHLKATAATQDRNAVGKAFVSMTKNLHSNACEPVEQSSAKAATDSERTGLTNAGSQAADVTNCLQVHLKDSLAVLDGIAQQQVHVGGRTILIWVGAGWPLLSDLEATPKVRKSYSDEFVTILNDLRASQVTVDNLGTHEADISAAPRSVDHPEELNALTGSPMNAGPASLALPMLAQQTGGRVITDSNDIPGDLGKLLYDAEWYYALSFNPPPSANGVELRSLEVKVNRPGLNVRTMTGYYPDSF
jgi:VWFA-related protein